LSKNRLGKGLAALIPEIENHKKREQILELAIKLIKPNPYQPRKEFNEEHLRELANSIKEKGLIQPILVRKTIAGEYELIAGERRLRASELAGYEIIPAIVKIVKSDVEMLEYAIIENTQRENLNPIEEAEAYQQLMVEFNYTQLNLSEKIGKERSTIANMLRLLNLPAEVQLLLKERVLTAGHARALLSLDNDEEILRLAKRVLRDKLSVRQTESKIEIEFHSEDELNHLLEIFNVVPDM